MGPVEQALLKNSIDLVVPNARYLPRSTRPDRTPRKLVDSNLSNLYLDLLTDWLGYADRHRLPREVAFYHVARATPFAGDSPSSQPVSWFWNVTRCQLSETTGSTSGDGRAASGAGRRPRLASAKLVIGYHDRFREINLTVARAARRRGPASSKYPAAVDANGRPTAWKCSRWRRTHPAGFAVPAGSPSTRRPTGDRQQFPGRRHGSSTSAPGPQAAARPTPHSLRLFWAVTMWGPTAARPAPSRPSTRLRTWTAMAT